MFETALGCASPCNREVQYEGFGCWEAEEEAQ